MTHARSGRNKKTLGFTLIELLVVISIISLLSSVVLAAVGEAKDKAKVAKFRQEMQQFITALELYKADNGVYPNINGYNTSQCNNKRSTGVEFRYDNKINFNCLVVFSGLSITSLNSYSLNMAPRVINPNSTTAILYYYRVNFTEKTIGSFYRCDGDVSIPEYVIYITSSNSLMYNAFANWPQAETSPDGTGWNPLPNTRCFSLK
jgi:prepilin-type N-terminal cleavage/methylation domain-containing protein